VVVAFHGINKHLKGLGFAVIMTGSVVATYYVPILAWVMHYFRASFHSSLPWKDRGMEFDMQDVIANKDPVAPENGGYVEYPGTAVIGETVGWCAFIWFTVWLCMFKGVGTTGRAVYFTMGLPVIMLIIILGRSVSLPDAGKGIKYYFGEWNGWRLGNGDIWQGAFSQIFFSIGVGFGYFTSYASYNTKYANAVQDALIIACCNSLYEITAGFAVFGVIGLLGYSPDDPSISLSTVTVDFLTYPLGLAEMPGSNVWAALFFLTLAVLGLSSAFALLESFVTLLCDSSLGRKTSRVPICTSVVVVAFPLSLIYCTEFGFYLLDAVDTWTNNLCLIFVVWCEVVSATTLYRFKDVIGQVGVAGYSVYSIGYILSMLLGVIVGQAEGPKVGAGVGFGVFVLTNVVAIAVSKTPDSGPPRFWGKNSVLTKLWWLSFYSVNPSRPSRFQFSNIDQGNQLRRDLNVVIATGKNWSIPIVWPVILRYVSAPILIIVVSFAYPAFAKKSNDPLQIFAFTVAHCVMLLIACGFVVPRWFDVFVPPEKMRLSKTFDAPHFALAPLEMGQSEIMEEENREGEDSRDSGEKSKGGIRQDADFPER
jgi:solute carrier family 6 GABA transporter-like protein 1